MKFNKKGFTLIELLVVIAIIGILASIVLVSVSGARNRARDARITADMGQMRSSAEVYYGNNSNSYTNFCTATDTVVLFADVASQGGTATTCIASATAYCSESQLNVTGQFWCVDSTLVSKQYSSNPSCGGSDYTCD